MNAFAWVVRIGFWGYILSIITLAGLAGYDMWGLPGGIATSLLVTILITITGYIALWAIIYHLGNMVVENIDRTMEEIDL